MEIAEGSFDYVICHGVVSWVSASVRANLLERIARALAPRGIACVTFNVLPGWYDRLAARDWLRFSATSLGRPVEEATTSLAWLGAQLSPEQADSRRRLEAVARRLEETGPAYALHEYLAEEHHPLLVGAFLEEAAATGLSYLGDAIPSTTAMELLPEPARERARSLDPIAAEQLVDFVRGTAFRRALLVRADAARAASWRTTPDLDSGAVRELRVASRLRPARPADPRLVRSRSRREVSSSRSRTRRRAAHCTSSRAWPRGRCGSDDLARRSLPAGASEAELAALSSELFELWLATGALDLLDHEPAMTATAGERPVACGLARRQARRGGVVTNRLHQEVLLPDAVVRWVLGRLDGTRTREDLAREARAQSDLGAATDAELELLVAATLDRLVACALIVDG